MCDFSDFQDKWWVVDTCLKKLNVWIQNRIKLNRNVRFWDLPKCISMQFFIGVPNFYFWAYFFWIPNSKIMHFSYDFDFNHAEISKIFYFDSNKQRTLNDWWWFSCFQMHMLEELKSSLCGNILSYPIRYLYISTLFPSTQWSIF